MVKIKDGTLSLDSFSVEVYKEHGADFVAISRYDSHGTKPGLLFKKGDSAPANIFLAQLAELLGVK